MRRLQWAPSKTYCCFSHVARCCSFSDCCSGLVGRCRYLVKLEAPAFQGGVQKGSPLQKVEQSVRTSFRKMCCGLRIFCEDKDVQSANVISLGDFYHSCYGLACCHSTGSPSVRTLPHLTSFRLPAFSFGWVATTTRMCPTIKGQNSSTCRSGFSYLPAVAATLLFGTFGKSRGLRPPSGT